MHGGRRTDRLLPGVTYVPPAFGADVDLDVLAAGEDVVVRGIGLAFVDLVVLLTEGRGGRFVPRSDGPGLDYVPSGREPRLHVGSRRGVPYACKPGYRLVGEKPSGPRFLTAEAVDELLSGEGALRFRRDVWPLVAREVAWHHYAELATGHPERVRIAWSDLDAGLAATAWGSTEQAALLADAVPDPADRFDVTALEEPLRGCWFPDREGVRRHIEAQVRADVDRRSDDSFSADLGAFGGFLAVFPALGRILASPRLDPHSLVTEFEDWWFGLFSAFASGPPPERLEQLLALSQAGVVSFLGAGLEVRVGDGVVRATSASTPAVAVGTALVDAVLPTPDLSRTRDRLLAALRDRGDVRSAVLVGPDGTEVDTGRVVVDRSLRLLAHDGTPHPRRFAVGHHTTARAPAFARVGTNAVTHHHDDQIARAILDLFAT